MKTYFCVFFGSAFLAQFATPVVARVARALGLVDRPAARKVHTSPVPRIGGVVIVIGVMALTIPVLALNNIIGEAFREIHWQIVALLGAAFFIFLIGLLDDIRSVPARYKLLSLVAASLAICLSGARFESISLDATFTLELGWLSWPITVLWIAGITVAMNFIDGLDGLAAGIALIVCGVIALLAFLSGQLVMGVLMLSLLGSLTGFLFFNFNPAKIFMGDCGSMFLGFMIGAGSVVCQAKTHTLVGIALPALALGVPLSDTALTFIRRKILDRRSIFAAERGHIHHRLLDMGLPQRHVVIIIYAITLLAAGSGMLMFVTHGAGTLAAMAFGLMLVLATFGVAGASRIRETLAAIHHNRTMAHQIKKEQYSFEDVQLQMRRVRSFDEWWKAACALAQKMEFDRLAVTFRSGPGATDTYSWRRTDEELRPRDVISVSMPLNGKGADSSTHIELSVRENGSLETIGRRVSLFGRLMDEHCPIVTPGRARDEGEPTTERSGRSLVRRSGLPKRDAPVGKMRASRDR